MRRLYFLGHRGERIFVIAAQAYKCTVEYCIGLTQEAEVLPLRCSKRDGDFVRRCYNRIIDASRKIYRDKVKGEIRQAGSLEMTINTVTKLGIRCGSLLEIEVRYFIVICRASLHRSISIGRKTGNRGRKKTNKSWLPVKERVNENGKGRLSATVLYSSNFFENCWLHKRRSRTCYPMYGT